MSDHIGLPAYLYQEYHKFLKPGGAFVQVGAVLMLTFAHRLTRLSFLGGNWRKYLPLLTKNSRDNLVQIADRINREGSGLKLIQLTN